MHEHVILYMCTLSLCSALPCIWLNYYWKDHRYWWVMTYSCACVYVYISWILHLSSDLLHNRSSCAIVNRWEGSRERGRRRRSRRKRGNVVVVLDESDESSDEVQIMEPGYADQCMMFGDFVGPSYCVAGFLWENFYISVAFTKISTNFDAMQCG